MPLHQRFVSSIMDYYSLVCYSFTSREWAELRSAFGWRMHLLYQTLRCGEVGALAFPYQMLLAYVLIYCHFFPAVPRRVILEGIFIKMPWFFSLASDHERIYCLQSLQLGFQVIAMYTYWIVLNHRF